MGQTVGFAMGGTGGFRGRVREVFRDIYGRPSSYELGVVGFGAGTVLCSAKTLERYNP